MKYLFIIILILGFSVIAHSIDRYSKGDTLYNWAASGLKMRSDRNFKAEVILVIPFSAKVIMQENKSDDLEDYYLDDQCTLLVRDSQERQSYQEKIAIEGNWAFVEFEGARGWVFDSYLSRLIADTDMGREYMDLLTYFQRYYGYLPGIDLVDSRPSGTTHYELGELGHAIQWLDDNKGSTTLIFYNLSFEEFYLLVNALNRWQMGIEARQMIKTIRKNLEYKELFIEKECGSFNFFEVQHKLVYEEFLGC